MGICSSAALQLQLMLQTPDLRQFASSQAGPSGATVWQRRAPAAAAARPAAASIPPGLD
jgi:hypothetical protein